MLQTRHFVPFPGRVERLGTAGSADSACHPHTIERQLWSCPIRSRRSQPFQVDWERHKVLCLRRSTATSVDSSHSLTCRLSRSSVPNFFSTSSYSQEIQEQE